MCLTLNRMKCTFTRVWIKKKCHKHSTFVVDLFLSLFVSLITIIFANFLGLGIVSDPEEGILIESFEYRTSHGFQFTVISDSQEKTNEIKAVFEAASEMPAI